MSAPTPSHRPLKQLLALARRGGHRLARDVVVEMARHDDDAVVALEQVLREPWPWEDDEVDAWWLRLHAVMALGLIPTLRAGALLLAFLERIAAEGDEEFEDFVSGYWPALMRNKPDEAAERWRASALSPATDIFARIEAVQVVLSFAEREGPEPLELALDWVASIATDEGADPTVRAVAGSYLLDFPRERFREAMLGVARATAEENAFSEDDVIAALADGSDDPEWRRFEDPWSFYDPGEADRREERWAEEDALAAPEPFVRDVPKVGRNDPCPCGSGKKFKRCCGAEAS